MTYVHLYIHTYTALRPPPQLSLVLFSARCKIIHSVHATLWKIPKLIGNTRKLSSHLLWQQAYITYSPVQLGNKIKNTARRSTQKISEQLLFLSVDLHLRSLLYSLSFSLFTAEAFFFILWRGPSTTLLVLLMFYVYRCYLFMLEFK